MKKKLFILFALLPLTLFGIAMKKPLTQSKDVIETEVLVVGGGPVGTYASLELNAHGISNIVLEKHKEVFDFHPRAQSINGRSMQLLNRHGLDAKLREAANLGDEYYNGVLWTQDLTAEKPDREFPLSSEQEDNYDEISPLKELRCPLWKTEKILRQKVSESEYSTFLTGYQAVDVKMLEDGVQVLAIEKDTKRQILFKAKYLLACDGANSQTRKLLGVTQTELDRSLPMVNIVYHSKELMEQMKLKKALLYFVLGKGKPLATGPIDEDGLWYAILSPDNGTITKEEAKEELKYYTGLDLDYDIRSAYVWQMQVKMTDQYQKERAFFVGDSAHVMYPTGGLGLNTGFGDAQNIAWKVAAVLKGLGSEKLLETYETERKPVAEQNMRVASIIMRRTLKASNPEFAKEMKPMEDNLDKEMRDFPHFEFGYQYHDPSIIDLHSEYIPTGGEYIASATPGHFIPHIANGINLYDELGYGFTLLVPTEFDAKKKQEMISIAKDKNIALEVIALTDEERGETYEPYSLVRPDLHIVWSGKECPEDLDQLLDLSLGK